MIVLAIAANNPREHSLWKGNHSNRSISGLVVEYIVAIDVTRVRFPADALLSFVQGAADMHSRLQVYIGPKH